MKTVETTTSSPNSTNAVLAVRANNPPNNCTRSEALKHYGFIEVGRKSIRGNSYSKCWYNDKLNIFAVPFMWRTSFHKFMSRDEKVQKIINDTTSEMWYGVDVINYFKRLSEQLGVIA